MLTEQCEGYGQGAGEGAHRGPWAGSRALHMLGFQGVVDSGAQGGRRTEAHGQAAGHNSAHFTC